MKRQELASILIAIAVFTMLITFVVNINQVMLSGETEINMILNMAVTLSVWAFTIGGLMLFIAAILTTIVDRFQSYKKKCK